MPLPGDRSPPGELPSLQYDREARDLFKIDMPKIGKIALQFPPKITSDGKSAFWQEDNRYGYEEFALWLGSSGRAVNIELNYVVWGSFDQQKIHDEIGKIKRHLYVGAGKLTPFNSKIPFFFIEGWKTIDGSKKPVPFRLKSVSISYSREYVGSGNNYWPLHTKVDIACKMFTRSGMTAGQTKFKEENFDGIHLPELPNVEWA
jgi:hypothetical protein